MKVKFQTHFKDRQCQLEAFRAGKVPLCSSDLKRLREGDATSNQFHTEFGVEGSSVPGFGVSPGPTTYWTQHMSLSLLESLKNSKRKKERASEIPEWIDRCYVIGAASSTPQEARSREKEAVQQQGPPEQALLLTEAGSWTSKKKQPRVFLVSS